MPDRRQSRPDELRAEVACFDTPGWKLVEGWLQDQLLATQMQMEDADEVSLRRLAGQMLFINRMLRRPREVRARLDNILAKQEQARKRKRPGS